MPIFRKDDGEIVEEPTEFIKQPDTNATVDEKTVPVNRHKSNIFSNVDNSEMDTPQHVAAADDDDKTRIYRPSSRRKAEQKPEQTAHALEDPVVGWVVLVKGPGKGTALSLGYGMNSIGRSAESRISLDFGDEGISRDNHAIITYEPRKRKYYFQHGGGKNLSYLDDEPVLTPVEISSEQEITIGDTTMRFVSLCGETFDWQDQDD